MSNDVYLYAATGEIKQVKSLSGDVHLSNFLAMLGREHQWAVPVLWVDVDYPLVKLGGTAVCPPDLRTDGGRTGPYFGGWEREAEAAARILSWGGTVWERVERNWWYKSRLLNPGAMGDRWPSRIGARGAYSLDVDELTSRLDVIIEQVAPSRREVHPWV